MAKVLIVDDDNTTVSLLKTLLSLDGFDVDSTGNGSEVLAKIASFQPDVILMDYHLTDMEGVDVIREIRAHADYAHLPIVMASGLDVSDVAMAAGANEFLIKPFEPDDLPVIFNKLIG